MKIEEIIIEDYRESDLNNLSKLFITFKRETEALSPVHDKLVSDIDNLVPRKINEFVEGHQSRIFLARTKSEICGFIFCTVWPYMPIYTIKEFGYIPELYVVPKMRGQGIGKRLIHDAESWFRAIGLHYSRIETIMHYERNKYFYHELGYDSFLLDMRKCLTNQ